MARSPRSRKPHARTVFVSTLEKRGVTGAKAPSEKRGRITTEALMQDAPGSDNHGRSSVQGSIMWEDDWTTARRTRRWMLGPDSSGDYMVNSGWCVIAASYGRGEDPDEDRRGGITSHRGVLHKEDHVDPHLLFAALELYMGVTMEDFDSAYRTRGRPPKPDSPAGLARESTRHIVDEVFGALVRSRASNIELLARVLGIKDERIYEAARRVGVHDHHIESAKTVFPIGAGVAPYVHPVSYRHQSLPGQQFSSKQELDKALAALRG